MNALEPSEKDVINALAHAWNMYMRLTVEHPDDRDEFRRLIHAAQEKVAARPAFRVLRAEVKHG